MNDIKQTVQKLFRKIQRLPLGVRIAGSIVLFVIISYGLIFGIPKSVSFAYGGENCTRQLTLFPDLSRQTSDSGYNVSFQDRVGLFNNSIVSFKTCFAADEVPQSGKAGVVISPLGSWFAAKRFTLIIPEAPVARITDFVGKTLPTTRPVGVRLTQPDDVFTYKLQIEDKTADCTHANSTLQCDIEPLHLTQGQEYSVAMVRYFNGKALKTLGEGKMTTLKALVLVSSTLADGQIVYDKPTSFTFEYDKTLDKADVEIKARNGDTLQTVESTTKTEDKKIIVTPKAELARNTQFVLTIKEAEAEDGSAIPIELIVNFSMSGGPKVTGISAAKTGVALGGSIIVYFDQEIANVDAIASLAVVNGLNAQVVKSGNNLVINYTAGTCTDFSITVKKGLESAAGVTQQDEWGYAGRTICYTVRSIGASRQGRAITATTFGAGAKTILFTGAIHGNEISSRNLMNLWINELDANARSIPAGVRVVVIPTINPDGVAANSRYNAAGVDLNRNFDTSDWKKDVETVNGTPLPNGGGATRASEPETQAMVNITRELRPVLTMSYHSSASYAIANTCGNSGGLASAYAQITGYRNMTGVSGAFAYQITGTYDDWICERLGLASVLIELASSTNAEFSRNRAAMWAMVRS